MSKKQAKQFPTCDKVAVGIDVAQDTLAIHIAPEGVHFETTNDPAGFNSIIDRIKPFNPELVIMEGTGGLETNLAITLNEVGLPVAIVNPRQVRGFASGLGYRAKTDAIDAEVLALFAQVAPIQPRTIPDEQGRRLKELVARRNQLVGMRDAESNRLRNTVTPEILASIRFLLQTLKQQIAEIDREVNNTIKSSPLWNDSDKLLQSVKGIGKVIASILLSKLPELGRLNRREIAALAGLAPYNKDSGKKEGYRCISGGRSDVRRALYLATLTAKKWNPVIKTYYNHLINDGHKKPKVAMVACMRKLLIILNAMMKQKIATSNLIVAVSY